LILDLIEPLSIVRQYMVYEKFVDVLPVVLLNLR
jgi:hypothetical protein